ncbi:MAG TPA: Hsp20/alpha crystallin family protein [Accumulibacter sp.]|uniref:Hsp20/alpha crystallin family protein n=2 Tax=Accumulibacter sp. TaxID=2053492 RepID=UPI00287B3AAE|nr:Hsp20/alpha crystallin family protein [Accumulibacter sp.]MDS4056665.1 Hsp20/alpha crystallin family protein [Accumulibacter sp.]HMV05797.1 Hsp20/alpha crystallin family protein [Accumulibacter sp.]HMW79209.1 Hsp20/alpha crystallin family protein [Accumulibacter sp.]HNB67604.1 Hsp20/alpha crystallin family protein [Accumulibacter sp.]HNC26649.1 Hsp20/alpha crystallin family protein [Accumulibacter sp.]
MRSREGVFVAWAEALELLQGAERLQHRFVSLRAQWTGPCWEPAVDLYEEADELRLLVSLPGVSPCQIEVALDEAGLLVRGERPRPCASPGTAIRRLEIPYGRFERRVPLPPGRYRLVQQSLADGCLLLVLRHR